MKAIAIPTIAILITIIVIYTVLVHLINWLFRDTYDEVIIIACVIHIVITILTIFSIYKLF